MSNLDKTDELMTEVMCLSTDTKNEQRKRNSEWCNAYYKKNKARLDNIQRIRRLFKYIPDMDMKKLREMYNLKDDEETKQALQYLRERKQDSFKYKINTKSDKWKIQLRASLRNKMVKKCKDLGIDYNEEFSEKYENVFLCYVMFRKMLKAKFNVGCPTIEYLSEGLITEEELQSNFRRKLSILKNMMDE